MFQSAMRIGFTIAIVILTLDLIVSLLVWLFRSQKEIRKSNKVWDKEFYNIFGINSYYYSYTNYNW